MVLVGTGAALQASRFELHDARPERSGFLFRLQNACANEISDELKFVAGESGEESPRPGS
jgi:hypothetical protein